MHTNQTERVDPLFGLISLVGRPSTNELFAVIFRSNRVSVRAVNPLSRMLLGMLAVIDLLIY